MRGVVEGARVKALWATTATSLKSLLVWCLRALGIEAVVGYLQEHQVVLHVFPLGIELHQVTFPSHWLTHVVLSGLYGPPLDEYERKAFRLSSTAAILEWTFPFSISIYGLECVAYLRCWSATCKPPVPGCAELCMPLSRKPKSDAILSESFVSYDLITTLCLKLGGFFRIRPCCTAYFTQIVTRLDTQTEENPRASLQEGRFGDHNKVPIVALSINVDMCDITSCIKGNGKEKGGVTIVADVTVSALECFIAVHAEPLKTSEPSRILSTAVQVPVLSEPTSRITEPRLLIAEALKATGAQADSVPRYDARNVDDEGNAKNPTAILEGSTMTVVSVILAVAFPEYDCLWDRFPDSRVILFSENQGVCSRSSTVYQWWTVWIGIPELTVFLQPKRDAQALGVLLNWIFAQSEKVSCSSRGKRADVETGSQGNVMRSTTRTPLAGTPITCETERKTNFKKRIVYQEYDRRKATTTHGLSCCSSQRLSSANLLLPCPEERFVRLPCESHQGLESFSPLRYSGRRMRVFSPASGCIQRCLLVLSCNRFQVCLYEDPTANKIPASAIATSSSNQLEPLCTFEVRETVVVLSGTYESSENFVKMSLNSSQKTFNQTERTNPVHHWWWRLSGSLGYVAVRHDSAVSMYPRVFALLPLPVDAPSASASLVRCSTLLLIRPGHVPGWSYPVAIAVRFEKQSSRVGTYCSCGTTLGNVSGMANRGLRLMITRRHETVVWVAPFEAVLNPLTLRLMTSAVPEILGGIAVFGAIRESRSMKNEKDQNCGCISAPGLHRSKKQKCRYCRVSFVFHCTRLRLRVCGPGLFEESPEEAGPLTPCFLAWEDQPTGVLGTAPQGVSTPTYCRALCLAFPSLIIKIKARRTNAFPGLAKLRERFSTSSPQQNLLVGVWGHLHMECVEALTLSAWDAEVLHCFTKHQTAGRTCCVLRSCKVPLPYLAEPAKSRSACSRPPLCSVVVHYSGTPCGNRKYKRQKSGTRDGTYPTAKIIPPQGELLATCRIARLELFCNLSSTATWAFYMLSLVQPWLETLLPTVGTNTVFSLPGHRLRGSLRCDSAKTLLRFGRPKDGKDSVFVSNALAGSERETTTASWVLGKVLLEATFDVPNELLVPAPLNGGDEAASAPSIPQASTRVTCYCAVHAPVCLKVARESALSTLDIEDGGPRYHSPNRPTLSCFIWGEAAPKPQLHVSCDMVRLTCVITPLVWVILKNLARALAGLCHTFGSETTTGGLRSRAIGDLRFCARLSEVRLRWSPETLFTCLLYAKNASAVQNADTRAIWQHYIIELHVRRVLISVVDSTQLHTHVCNQQPGKTSVCHWLLRIKASRVIDINFLTDSGAILGGVDTAKISALTCVRILSVGPACWSISSERHQLGVAWSDIVSQEWKKNPGYIDEATHIWFCKVQGIHILCCPLTLDFFQTCVGYLETETTTACSRKEELLGSGSQTAAKGFSGILPVPQKQKLRINLWADSFRISLSLLHWGHSLVSQGAACARIPKPFGQFVFSHVAFKRSFQAVAGLELLQQSGKSSDASMVAPATSQKMHDNLAVRVEVEDAAREFEQRAVRLGGCTLSIRTFRLRDLVVKSRFFDFCSRAETKQGATLPFSVSKPSVRKVLPPCFVMEVSEYLTLFPEPSLALGMTAKPGICRQWPRTQRQQNNEAIQNAWITPFLQSEDMTLQPVEVYSTLDTHVRCLPFGKPRVDKEILQMTPFDIDAWTLVNPSEDLTPTFATSDEMCSPARTRDSYISNVNDKSQVIRRFNFTIDCCIEVQPLRIKADQRFLDTLMLFHRRLTDPTGHLCSNRLSTQKMSHAWPRRTTGWSHAALSGYRDRTAKLEGKLHDAEEDYISRQTLTTKAQCQLVMPCIRRFEVSQLCFIIDYLPRRSRQSRELLRNAVSTVLGPVGGIKNLRVSLPRQVVRHLPLLNEFARRGHERDETEVPLLLSFCTPLKPFATINGSTKGRIGHLDVSPVEGPALTQSLGYTEVKVDASSPAKGDRTEETWVTRDLAQALSGSYTASLADQRFWVAVLKLLCRKGWASSLRVQKLACSVALHTEPFQSVIHMGRATASAVGQRMSLLPPTRNQKRPSRDKDFAEPSFYSVCNPGNAREKSPKPLSRLAGSLTIHLAATSCRKMRHVLTKAAGVAVKCAKGGVNVSEVQYCIPIEKHLVLYEQSATRSFPGMPYSSWEDVTPLHQNDHGDADAQWTVLMSAQRVAASRPSMLSPKDFAKDAGFKKNPFSQSTRRSSAHRVLPPRVFRPLWDTVQAVVGKITAPASSGLERNTAVADQLRSPAAAVYRKRRGRTRSGVTDKRKTVRFSKRT